MIQLPLPSSTKQHRQRGVAAVEFALITLFVIVPILVTFFVYCDVLLTQQVVGRATGDGARQVVRALQAGKVPNANGQLPTDAQMRATVAAQAQESIGAALGSHLSATPAEINQRLNVSLQPNPDKPDTLLLDVAYARPNMLGPNGKPNPLEPASFRSRSVIQLQ